MKEYENIAYANDYQLVGGLDEVGRGSIGGPLVCALVIFPKDYNNLAINDSKLLSASKRNILAKEIQEQAIDYQIETISNQIVDQVNPKNASKLCMVNCLKNIKTKPDYCLIDFEKLDIDIPSQSITKGDQKSISIAAASIVAKVYRDNIMVELATKYPNYGFDKHKGYLTKLHREAIQTYGPLKDVHRFSYRLIKKDKY